MPATLTKSAVHFHLVLNQADYRALCREWVRRREQGERVNMSLLIREKIRQAPRVVS